MNDRLILKIAGALAAIGFFVGFFLNVGVMEIPDRAALNWQRAVSQRLDNLLERPEDFGPWRDLGQFLGRLDTLDQSIGWWREHAPESFRERWGDGIIWYWIGRTVEPEQATEHHREAWRRAAEDLQFFVDARPDDLHILHLHYLAWANIRLQRQQSTAEAFDHIFARLDAASTDEYSPMERVALLVNVAAGAQDMRMIDARRHAIDRLADIVVTHGSQNSFNWFDVAEMYESVGDAAGGARMMRHAEKRIAELPSYNAYRFCFNIARRYASLGYPDDARRLWRRSADIILSRPLPQNAPAGLENEHIRDEIDAYNLACALAMAGEPEAALDALEQAVDLGYADDTHTENDTDLDSIRSYDRYFELLDRMETMRREREDAASEDQGLRQPRFDRR
jgi:tetratricopeptide (TPR) repeat protein